MNIIDKNGAWYVNEGQFAIVDTTAKLVARFEPGEPVKATVTDWVKAQPTLKRCGDPSSDLSEREQAKLDAQNAADEAERAKAQLAAENAQAAARGEAPAAAAAAAAAAPADDDIGVSATDSKGA